MTDAMLERRVAALEKMAQDYTEKAVSDDRLTAGVERLADETGGLNAVLHKVDEQQQRLSNLGRDLERVEKSKVSKEDLEKAKKEQQAATLDFRKRTLTRIYTTGFLLILGLVVMGAAFAWYQAEKRQEQFKICQDRNAQNQIIVDILKGSIQDVPPERENSPGVVNVRQGIERFERLIISCEDGL